VLRAIGSLSWGGGGETLAAGARVTGMFIFAVLDGLSHKHPRVLCGTQIGIEGGGLEWECSCSAPLPVGLRCAVAMKFILILAAGGKLCRRSCGASIMYCQHVQRVFPVLVVS
jgi:hypothetical protein